MYNDMQLGAQTRTQHAEGAKEEHCLSLSSNMFYGICAYSKVCNGKQGFAPQTLSLRRVFFAPGPSGLQQQWEWNLLRLIMLQPLQSKAH